MRKTLLVILGLAFGAPSMAQDRGLTATAEALGGPRWQTRFESELPLLSLGQGRPEPLLGTMPGTLRLLGDYQFNLLRLGETGGLRLTGGVLISLRPSQGSTAQDQRVLAQGAMGYAGVGYAFGSQRGWGFTADLGLTGLALGNGAGDAGPPRELRGQPVIRLGVNMAF